MQMLATAIGAFEVAIPRSRMSAAGVLAAACVGRSIREAALPSSPKAKIHRRRIWGDPRPHGRQQRLHAWGRQQQYAGEPRRAASDRLAYENRIVTNPVR